MKTFEIGVRDLVSYVLRSGSIDTRGSGKNRLLEGARIHKEIQEEQESLYKDYQSEVFLKEEYLLDDYRLILSGRADAIYKDKDLVIEEIKSTTKYKSEKFQINEAHKIQLFFYGYLYLKANNLNRIHLRLRYFHTPTAEETVENYYLNINELKELLDPVIRSFLSIGIFRSDWIDLRNKTIDNLSFVYGDFRKGQREMSLAVYNTIKRKNKVFIEAPTGIGKTAASLFPALKSLLEFSDHQIYYLTAKTTIQQEAKKALNHMREQGLKLKSVIITARDKLCPLINKEGKLRSCNPDDCIYARDYFDKLPEILKHLLKQTDDYDRDLILKIALDNEVCPYQLSLDLSNWCDVIIGDYNYLFDPVSRLETINSKRICLIDEAHNLPDRSRGMYSAELNIFSFQKLKRALFDKEEKKIRKKGKALYRRTEAIINYLRDLTEEMVIDEVEIKELDDEAYSELLEKINSFQQAASIYFLNVQNKKIPYDPEIMQAYNECSKDVFNFSVISEIFDSYPERFQLYSKLLKNGIVIRLACLDASKFLALALENLPAIFFSATLTPFEYYKNVILGNESTPSISFPSPFNRENFKVFCDSSISTRYSDREFSYGKIAEEIKLLLESKPGHYLVFFPSYTYLNKVKEIFEKFRPNGYHELIQTNNMDESQREEFINKFKDPNIKSLVGFCVMGGIFSEGIDLPGDELIGSIIVGPGIPGIDYERDLLKEYYQEENGQGFAYAYAYPGMNRVLQSAGRVIRTEEDVGIILLIDERFKNPYYKEMLPAHLTPEYLTNLNVIQNKIENFWKDKK